jgi:serine/threonine protein kinase
MQELHHELLVEIRTAFIQSLTLGRQQVNIVMEYCAGGDLASYARSHAPLGEPRVLQLLTPVLSALAFVHSRGIAHCDIKPQNSMVTQSNQLPLAVPTVMQTY